MATPKKAAAGVVGAFLVEQAGRIAQDPDVHKAVAEAARPAAARMGEAAKSAKGKVKLPHRADPFAQLEASLDVVAQLVEQHSPGADPAATAEWRRRITSLRNAIPLAKADQGKGRRTKLKDLQARQKALLDEVYTAVVEAQAPAQ